MRRGRGTSQGGRGGRSRPSASRKKQRDAFTGKEETNCGIAGNPEGC